MADSIIWAPITNSVWLWTVGLRQRWLRFQCVKSPHPKLCYFRHHPNQSKPSLSIFGQHGNIFGATSEHLISSLWEQIICGQIFWTILVLHSNSWYFWHWWMLFEIIVIVTIFRGCNIRSGNKAYNVPRAPPAPVCYHRSEQREAPPIWALFSGGLFNWSKNLFANWTFQFQSPPPPRFPYFPLFAERSSNGFVPVLTVCRLCQESILDTLHWILDVR